LIIPFLNKGNTKLHHRDSIHPMRYQRITK
jgi:hypothetical protein